MTKLAGIGAAPGICRAKAYFYKKEAVGTQSASFDTALKSAVERVRELYKRISADSPEQAEIFFAYEMLLSDEKLIEPIRQKIEHGEDAAAAVRSVTAQMSESFSGQKNEYMRRRGDDIRYIGELICDALCAKAVPALPHGSDKIILAAHELTPVDTMAVDTKRLAGIVTTLGGTTSHTVILAKSLGIPAIVGISGIGEWLNGKICFADGSVGELVADADAETEKMYTSRLEQERNFQNELAAIRSQPAHTADGERITLCVNIGKPEDMRALTSHSYDGVGLFRTEFLYSSSVKKPSPDEQIKAYAEVINAAEPNTVTIRTLDIGGDKHLSYMNMKSEENPFLGNRGIRLCKGNKEIFAEQLRSVITASDKPIKLLLPMITLEEEIEWARALLEKVKNELVRDGRTVSRKIYLGIMIETPASAIMADALAPKCDFFSIGTNDLIQYITAADRGNADVETLYNPCNPAVIRLLAYVAQAADKHGITASVCGDLAARCDFVALLLGIGIKSLSVPAPMLERIKHKILHTDMSKARKLASRVLAATSTSEVERLLQNEQ